jgi:hypothetical protein
MRSSTNKTYKWSSGLIWNIMSSGSAYFYYWGQTLLQSTNLLVDTVHSMCLKWFWQQLCSYAWEKSPMLTEANYRYCHAGDKGGRKYSSYSLLTSALDGSEWSASYPGRALFPGKDPPLPIVQEAGWASKVVWTQRLEEKNNFKQMQSCNILITSWRAFLTRDTGQHASACS